MSAGWKRLLKTFCSIFCPFPVLIESFLMHQPCTFSLIALKIRITVSAVEKTLFLRWMRKLSVLLTGCLWPVWNGSMGFTLKEMSSILMLSGFSLKWKRHWSLLLTFTCLFRLWSFSLFSSHSYPFFFFGRPSLLFLSLCFSYRRTSETLSQASLKATAAFTNMGSAITRKLEDVRWVRRGDVSESYFVILWKATVKMAPLCCTCPSYHMW